MSLTSRKTIREEIAGVFTSALTAAQEVLDYPPSKLEGKSPVVSLHNGGTTPHFYGKDTNQIDHIFIVTIYINREAHGAEGAEDLLDTLYTAVIQAVRDNVAGTDYSELDVDESQSQPAFSIIDGVPYRTEEIRIMARSNPTG